MDFQLHLETESVEQAHPTKPVCVQPSDSIRHVMRVLKSKYGLRGIAISGFGLEEDVENARAAGFSAHLTKPVSFEAVRAALDSIVPSK